MTKQQAKENLAKLVEKYREVVEQGRVNEYNEEATKTSFIQPLLKDVLGWDVNDYNEVSPEERISRGRVDYCLKIDGKPKIFVEAKPLKADINKHIEQAVRYGYNRKGVPFVLLTDFEELMLFDVTVKPDIRNPNKGRKVNLYWKFYEMYFDQIWTLSKESVINGELDKLLLAKPKDRIPVDKAILDDLKEWRETLAKDIYKNNTTLFEPSSLSSPTEGGRLGGGGAEYLKEITQRLLDRIIFMRFCEDRQFVHRRTLKELFEERTESVGLNTMVFLKEEFKHYNIIFDSDLFNQKDWEKDLQIDFRVMNKIVKDTYNPYQFDVIPLEVLGNIYEQYLGYTIRLTPQQVKYELKPDVRKAGGVYYTPEYIVDYIVKNTVGKILKDESSLSLRSCRRQPRGNLTSKKIKKLRILDPACGSGSFLIRAYEEMLNYYRNQKKGLKPQVNTDAHGKSTPHLTSPARGEGKFGAENSSPLTGEDLGGGELQKELDLKHEDIEIRLTISEKAEILRKHIFGVDIDEQAVEVTKLSLMLKMLEGEFGIIPGRNILPMLDKNIRCGNSLISGSPLELKKYFGDDYYKVKPFNWEEEFKEIFADDGFDVVIGNPPYIRPHKLPQNIKSYLWGNYRPIFEAKSDIYACFMKRSLDLLKLGGRMSFIVSKTWLSLESFRALREYILSQSCVYLLASPPKKVFDKATVETIVVVLKRETNNKARAKNRIQIASFDGVDFHIDKEITQANFMHTHLNTFDLSINEFTARLNEKMLNNTLPLNKCVQFFYGLKTGDDSKFISTKPLTSEYKKLLRRSDFIRYGIRWGKEYVWYVPDKMIEHRKTSRPGTPGRFESPKIMVLDIAKKIVATIDKEHYYVKDALLFLKENNFELEYILGLINSRLMNYYYSKTFTTLSVAKNAILTLPIRIINFSKPSDRKLHDNLVALVDVMLDLNKKIQTAKGSAKEQIQRQLEKTDKEIDNLVYKLYGITEEEKKVIEG